MARLEIFTAGSYLCEDVVEQAKELACTQCEVTVYDLNKRSGMKEAEEKAKAYGVKFVPAVAINGKLVDFEIMKKARLGHLSYSD